MVKSQASFLVFFGMLLHSLVLFSASLPTEMIWVKGNLHTHTTNSDGRQPPATMVRWYKDNGYNFLFITDHNFLTTFQAESLKTMQLPNFLVLTGEEVSCSFNKHANVFCMTRTLFDSLEFIHPFLYLRNMLDLARSANALISINHPDWRFCVSTYDLMALSGVTHFELINEGKDGDNMGDSLHPSTEKMWDSLLTAGKRIFALTGDDAHNIDTTRIDRALIMGKTRDLSAGEILRSLKKGLCYGSTGPLFKSIEATQNTFRVSSEKPAHIEFIGTHGRTLTSVYGQEAEISLDTGEIYVRARITDSDSLKAWTQPVYLKHADLADSTEREADRFVQPLMRAEKLYCTGRLTAALDLYDSAMKHIPLTHPYREEMFFGILQRKGRICEVQGKEKEALKYFEQVLAGSPSETHKIMAAKEVYALTGSKPQNPHLPSVLCTSISLGNGPTPVIDGKEDDTLWENSAWIPFREYKAGFSDSVFFKIRHNASNIYIIIKAFLPDTNGLRAFDPLKNEYVGFFADPGRLGMAVVSAGERPKKLTGETRIKTPERFFISEYKIPVKLFCTTPVKKGDLWSFNIARSYGKYGDHGWQAFFAKANQSGWADRSGEASKAPYLGLLRFE